MGNPRLSRCSHPAWGGRRSVRKTQEETGVRQATGLCLLARTAGSGGTGAALNQAERARRTLFAPHAASEVLCGCQRCVEFVRKDTSFHAFVVGRCGGWG